MQTSLIAGGAGFIGSHVCDFLLSAGHNVICIDNLISGDRKNIEHLLGNPKFSFLEIDITSPLSILENGLPAITHVFHLASPASPNKKSPRSYINHPIETLLANSTGTQNLLEIAKRNNAKFLYASSSEVYGDPSESPQNEEYFGNVNPSGIRSVYDEGKRFGEAMTMTYFRTYNTDVRIVRIFNTYGPRMQADDGRAVSNFIVQGLSKNPLTIYGDGKQTRSFCFVSDMVDGIVRAMLGKDTKGILINLGNPDERTILELATMVTALTDQKMEFVFESFPEDDPKKRKPDITKAKKILDWEPKVSLEEGLKKTIEYFRKI